MSELTTNKSNSYLEQAAILLLCLGEEAAATVMQKLSREGRSSAPERKHGAAFRRQNQHGAQSDQ